MSAFYFWLWDLKKYAWTPFSVETIGLREPCGWVSDSVTSLTALNFYFLTWIWSSWTLVMMITRVPLLTDGLPCDDAVLSALEASSHLISITILNSSHFYPLCVTGKESELRAVESFAKGVNSKLRSWALACLYFTNLWIVVALWQSVLTCMYFLFFLFFLGRIKRWFS